MRAAVDDMLSAEAATAKSPEEALRDVEEKIKDLEEERVYMLRLCLKRQATEDDLDRETRRVESENMPIRLLPVEMLPLHLD